MILKIHNSYIFYENRYGYINDYYMYIVKILQNILESNSNIPVNIVLYCCGTVNRPVFRNGNKTIMVGVNVEHTLVKPRGSMHLNAPLGTIKDENNENYSIRIDNYDLYKTFDLVIDYSNPNIENVKTYRDYASFSKKHICITPSLYESYFSKQLRRLPVLTTFIDTERPRRVELINQLRSKRVDHTNVSDCFEKEALQTLYKSTKILINIHQTPDHHTFEELRVLPALQCGVLVVCETSPLREYIPYNDYIIWADYDKIVEKTQEVLDNYDIFHDLIFSNPKKHKLSDFDQINYSTLENKFLQLTRITLKGILNVR